MIIILCVRDVAPLRPFHCRGTELLGGHPKAGRPARITSVYSSRCTMSCLLQSSDAFVTTVSPDWFAFTSWQLSLALLLFLCASSWGLRVRVCCLKPSQRPGVE